MTSDATLNRRMHIIIHGLGLGCIGGTIFLQILAFSSIAFQGYFNAYEKNPTVLFSEIILTAFAAIYFIYIYQLLIRQQMKH